MKDGHSVQLRSVILGAIVIFASWCEATIAATEPSTEAGHSTCKLRIDPQPLDAALQQFARQCGVQTAYFSDITNGLTSPGLSGVYSIDGALHRLLDPGGLAFSHIDAGTIEIQRAEAKPAGAEPSMAASANRGSRNTQTSAGTSTPLSEVIINGTAAGLVATRTETPLQDIPQTVSIIPAEQIRQQNNVSIGDTLADAVGITVNQLDSVNQAYYSRGFQITNYTLDGGASLHSLQLGAGNTIGLFFQLPDLSEFDRIEVLRGSDALFGANGTPGGTLNLVRKQPLEEGSLMFSSSVGSWSDYREELDATGPLGLEGTLRGRVDATFARQNYFYDGANDEHKSLFGVVADDLTPYTTLTVGGSYRWEDARPFENGLPQFSDGSDAHLPRGTSFTFDWARFDTQTHEAYLRLDHQIQGTWHLQVNTTWVSGAFNFISVGFSDPVTPITHALADPPGGQYTLAPGEHDQLSGEITITGHEVWLNIPVDIAFGGDHTHGTTSLATGNVGPIGAPLSSVYAFNPASYPNPFPSIGAVNGSGQSYSDLQSGLFASLKAQLAQPLFVTAGLRVSNEKTTATTTSIVNGTPYSFTPDEYDYVGKITPFVATEYRINDTYSIYASYADIYQANQGFVTPGGKLLSPADGLDIEGGVKGAWRDGALHGALAVYKIVQRGLPVPYFNVPITDFSNGCCWFPSGNIKSQGVDLELSGNLTPGWLIGSGYSYNTTSETATFQDPNGDLASPWTPRHLLKIWTSTRLPGSWQSWTVGATLLAQSRNFSQSFGCPTGECLTNLVPITSAQPSYAVISPRIGYRFDEHWQVALTINNLFDKRYYQTIGTSAEGSWYGVPRNYLLRLDARF
jgi:outer membrane receptor for ferric coprogen and ferric-rhodotorulic acid